MAHLPMARTCRRRAPGRLALGALLLCLPVLLPPDPAPAAGTIHNDPKGFRGIPWGSALDEVAELELVRTWRIVTEYRYRKSPITWADTALDSVTLSAVYGKFARVAIRYRGEQMHGQILSHLESRYGEIDYMPGAMVRGLNQQYTWRGPETEINLTYQGHGERGYLFIESRIHAPRFNDVLPDSAY